MYPPARVIALTCALASGCANPPQQPIRNRFDPCASAVAPGAASPEQIDAVRDGMALWNAAAGLHLALDAEAPPKWRRIPLEFQDAAGGFHGLYDDDHAIVFVNARLERAAQPVVIAHELGHAFGLVHVPPEERPSLMNPGNLDVPPTAEDVAALWAIWGGCERRAAPSFRP